MGKEKKALDDVVLVLQRLGGEISDNLELFEMSKADNDEAGLETLEEDTSRITGDIEKLEFRRMFNQPADPSNCFVDLQSGAGGTEACDWAQMLLRQYLKYAERKGFKTTIEDDVFVGSDTQFVAPVSIGKGATIGAGTTVTHDVPAGALAVSRAPQKDIAGYQRKRKRACTVLSRNRANQTVMGSSPSGLR